MIDPFCGSGSSLVAAKRTGRRYIVFEINEGYTRTTTARLNQSQPINYSIHEEAEKRILLAIIKRQREQLKNLQQAFLLALGDCPHLKMLIEEIEVEPP